MPKRNKPKVSTRFQRKPLTLEDIGQAFQPPMAQVSTSLAYKFSLILVAFLMIMLPLIYLCLIGGIAYYIHIDFLTRGLSATTWIGGFVIFFLIKPVFSRDAHHYPPLNIERSSEPLFFEYIDTLCNIIGAPKPNRVNVDCNLNAAASFHNGFLSLTKKELDLNIGLPLIVGLDSKQFTGVLSHELGHFSQKFGMSAYYIINRVNMWFHKVVYNRDIFDVCLHNIADSMGRLKIIALLFMYFVYLFVEASRLPLRLFMLIAHLFSNYLSRQMEFNADRNAMNIVGNRDFFSALKYIPVIDHAQQGAMADLSEAWREKRLGDNIPALVYNNIKRFSPELQKKMMANGLNRNTKLYGSHPSTADRIQHGSRVASKGIMHLERRPASDLFVHFEEICKNVTLSLYSAFDLDTNNIVLLETSKLIANIEQEEANNAAYKRYFQGQWGYNPLFVFSNEDNFEALSFEELQYALREAHEKFNADAFKLSESGYVLDTYDERIINLQAALLFKQSGFSFDPDKLQVFDNTVESIALALKSVKDEFKNGLSSIAGFRSLINTRINITHRLLLLPESEDLIEDISEVRSEFLSSIDNLSKLSDGFQLIIQLRYNWRSLEYLIRYFEHQSGNKDYVNTVDNQVDKIYEDLVTLKGQFTDMDYPFDHASSTSISVSDYLIDELPNRESGLGIFIVAEQCVSNFLALYHRLLGIISITGEAMEEACELPPIEHAQDEDDLPF